jgi:phosphoadenosine phosphosulfate reductase
LRSGDGVALVTDTLLGTDDLVADAISIIQSMEPEDGYYLAFSGGKDSVVVKHLMERAGVKFDAHYRVTTVDPPELVHFIRREHPDVEFDHPGTSMWKLIVAHRFPPLRQIRYCCQELKEGGGSGRLVVTGVRKAESVRRANRCITERDRRDKTKDYLHPIIYWSDADVWQYIRENDVPYCSLYDEGFRRLGCVMCCMSTAKQRKRDMERWPKIAAAYKRAVLKAWDKRVADGKKTHKFVNGEELFNWWISSERTTGAVSSEQEHFVFD